MSQALSLRFILADPALPDRMMTRVFQIAIDGEPVWPMAGLPDATLEIQVDDLLAYLAEHWKPLLLRQTYPAPFNPHRPSQLRADAAKRWDGVSSDTAEKEEDAVLAFEDAHDLSHAFGGLFDLPSFWMLRAGDGFQIESQERLWTLPYAHVVDALTDLGDRLSNLLATDSDKWAPLLNLWERRTEGAGAGLLAWSMGIAPAKVQALISEGMLGEPESFADVANDNDELRIAARMAGALPIEQIREILEIARDYPKREAPNLDTLSRACADEIETRWLERRPFVQGEVAARFVREHLDLGLDGPIDLMPIFHSLGVDVRAKDVDPDTLQGLAIWGPKHGPGVFLNLASNRAASSEPENPGDDVALRVTLAHELCHLLLDGKHAVSAVDVLKSRMPIAIEQRAKSFAGELLLPSRTAAFHWEALGRPHDREGVREVLLELEDRFGVPRAVSTWKLEHGLQFWDIDLSVLLSSLSRYR